MGMAAEVEYPKIHLVHVTPAEERDIAVFGLGACITDYTSTNIGYYSQALAEYYLRPMLAAKQSRKSAPSFRPARMLSRRTCEQAAHGRSDYRIPSRSLRGWQSGRQGTH